MCVHKLVVLIEDTTAYQEQVHTAISMTKKYNQKLRNTQKKSRKNQKPPGWTETESLSLFL